jgi:hypothetical protein
VVVAALSATLLVGCGGPRDSDPEVRAALDRVDPEMRALAGQLTAAVEGSVPGSARVGGGRVLPPCTEGQHNWKIDDPYDLRCGVAHVELVGVAGRDGFDDAMHALDRRLREAGWVPDQFSNMEDVLARQHADPPIPLSLCTATYRKGERSVVLGFVGTDAGPDDLTFTPDQADFRDSTGDEVTQEQLVDALPPEPGYGLVLTTGTTYFEE